MLNFTPCSTGKSDVSSRDINLSRRNSIFWIVFFNNIAGGSSVSDSDLPYFFNEAFDFVISLFNDAAPLLLPKLPLLGS